MKKIDCIRLQGGIGNQIFQYAYAIHVGRLLNRHVLLDARHLASFDAPRKFELPQLFSDAEDMLLQRNSDFSGGIILKFLVKHIVNTRLLKFASILGVEIENPSDVLLKNDRNHYRIGYWQNIAYVNAVRDHLLDTYIPIDCSKLTAFTDRIGEMGSNVVAMHVRRGDYVTNISANIQHGVMPESYFRDALNRIYEKLNHPLRIVIFSDDQNWVREVFKDTERYQFLPVMGFSDVDEMKLMAYCWHHIISNSSFSWWGSYFSTKDGFKIAPKKWFANGQKAVPNLFDEKWILI